MNPKPVEQASKNWAELKAVNERITRLQQYCLDPVEDTALDGLRRRSWFGSVLDVLFGSKWLSQIRTD